MPQAEQAGVDLLSARWEELNALKHLPPTILEQDGLQTIKKLTEIPEGDMSYHVKGDAVVVTGDDARDIYAELKDVATESLLYNSRNERVLKAGEAVSAIIMRTADKIAA